MVVLGVDPGIGRCGWGVIESNASSFQALDFGCIETSPKLATEKRLQQIHAHISKVIKKHKPKVLSIEDLFFGNNSKTALVVGEARGTILLAAAQNKMEIFVYKPTEVKMALTGYGNAEKSQVGQMIKIVLKLKSIPKPDDTADALAIGLTHAFSAKLKSYAK